MPQDKPYAFSRGCTWHGSPAHARISVRRKPEDDADPPLCCPSCGSVVTQVASAEQWWAEVHASDRQRPGYEDMVRWGQDRCFPDFDTMQNAYRQYMEGRS